MTSDYEDNLHGLIASKIGEVLGKEVSSEEVMSAIPNGQNLRLGTPDRRMIDHHVLEQTLASLDALPNFLDIKRHLVGQHGYQVLRNVQKVSKSVNETQSAVGMTIDVHKKEQRGRLRSLVTSLPKFWRRESIYDSFPSEADPATQRMIAANSRDHRVEKRRWRLTIPLFLKFEHGFAAKSVAIVTIAVVFLVSGGFGIWEWHIGGFAPAQKSVAAAAPASTKATPPLVGKELTAPPPGPALQTALENQSKEQYANAQELEAEVVAIKKEVDSLLSDIDKEKNTGAQQLIEARRVRDALQAKADELKRTREQLVTANGRIREAIQKASTSIKTGDEVIQKLQTPVAIEPPAPTPASTKPESIGPKKRSANTSPPTRNTKEVPSTRTRVPTTDVRYLTSPRKL